MTENTNCKDNNCATEGIIEHMNTDHKEALIDIAIKYAGLSDARDDIKVDDVMLKGVDFGGLDILYRSKDGEEVIRAEFPAVSNASSLRDDIIAMAQGAKKGFDAEKIKKELTEYRQGFRSVCIASISKEGHISCTYAPYIEMESECCSSSEVNHGYIYISEVAEHYQQIVDNPDKIEIMFLEDESLASSIILRKRLRYQVHAEVLDRGDAFDKIYTKFIAINKKSGALKTIRDLLDFHLVRLDFKSGRYVKGFGQAYDIKDGKITPPHMNNPHKFPDKKKK